MRLDLFPDWVRAWVGGQEVRAGDRVRFGEGVCQMLLQAPVDRRPADGLWLSPRFWDAGDPGREEAAWVGYAKRIRPYLENAVRLAPDSPVAVAAGKFLASLE
jgi:hypothetical protein